jgi:hypothetical protein
MSKGERIGMLVALGIALAITVPWFITQLQVWKEEGHDQMLLAANISLTALLWLVLILAVIRNFRDAKRADQKEAARITAVDELATKTQQFDRYKDGVELTLQQRSTRISELAGELSYKSNSVATLEGTYNKALGELEALRGQIAVDRAKGEKARLLTIHSAFYGLPTIRDIEITDSLQKRVGDGLAVLVSNALVPEDPIPNVGKRIEVEYSFGTRERKKVTRIEGELLVLPTDHTTEQYRQAVSASQRERKERERLEASAPRLIVECPQKDQRLLKITNDGSSAVEDVRVGTLRHSDDREITVIGSPFGSIPAKQTRERNINVPVFGSLWTAMRGASADALDQITITFEDGSGNMFEQDFTLTSEANETVTWKGGEVKLRNFGASF